MFNIALQPFQILKILSVDVATACHFGICIAIRTSEAVPLVNESLENEKKFNVSSLETALKLSGLGKRSKQRFLRSLSKDSSIVNARKGSGGNTVPYKCYIIKQSAMQGEVLELLRKGNRNTIAMVGM